MKRDINLFLIPGSRLFLRAAMLIEVSIACIFNFDLKRTYRSANRHLYAGMVAGFTRPDRSDLRRRG